MSRLSIFPFFVPNIPLSFINENNRKPALSSSQKGLFLGHFPGDTKKSLAQKQTLLSQNLDHFVDKNLF